MKITSHRQLLGDYGTLLPGETKDVREDIAKSLIRRGLATAYVEPTPVAPVEPFVVAQVDATKAITPTEQPTPVLDNKATVPAEQPAVTVETTTAPKPSRK